MVLYSDGRWHKDKGKLKNDKDKDKEKDQDQDKDKHQHKHKDLYDFEAAGKVWESYSRGGLGSEIRKRQRKRHPMTRQDKKQRHPTIRHDALCDPECFEI